MATVPDVDWLWSFHGLPPEHWLAHRGITHSLSFAAVLAGLLIACAFRGPSWHGTRFRHWLGITLAGASHRILDALSTYGAGVGFFIPFSLKRFFFAWRPFSNMPPTWATNKLLRVSALFGRELLGIWLPSLFLIYLRRRDRCKHTAQSGLRVLSLMMLFIAPVAIVAFSARAARELEVLPKRFVLQPGEQIHYTILDRADDGKLKFADGQFTVADPEIVRLINPVGVFEAIKAGRTELIVRTPDLERRIPIEVTGPAQQPIRAVPFSAVPQITAKEFLFVGHANLDGFDHTAVAKPGIDRLVQEAKRHGVPVVYWISREYPNWYTTDRRPDYAIISEGQEHDIRVVAQRVTFTGGSFMFCLLRNVQMTLHGMLKENKARRIRFVFPAQAIWVEDIWGRGDKRPYPAPMVLLTTLFAGRSSDVNAYNDVVVPFLDRMINQFPVAGYPPNPPAPPLRDLLKDWSIEVRFGERFTRFYQHGTSNRTLLIEFQDV